MNRSLHSYPHRHDGDSSAIADLQTDIMRFMAILALCLVAIFALVQSIPLAPGTDEDLALPAQGTTEPTSVNVLAITEPPPETAPAPVPRVDDANNLRRPTWTPASSPTKTKTEIETIAEMEIAVPKEDDKKGFTLSFESDLALTRLVAAGRVGFYAISKGRAQRMSVSNSRISFWDASVPNAFHEMETMTVPPPVVDALERTGIDSRKVDWGVTLPGKLRTQLDSIVRNNTGGNLVIGIDGELRREPS